MLVEGRNRHTATIWPVTALNSSYKIEFEGNREHCIYMGIAWYSDGSGANREPAYGAPYGAPKQTHMRVSAPLWPVIYTFT